MGLCRPASHPCVAQYVGAVTAFASGWIMVVGVSFMSGNEVAKPRPGGFRPAMTWVHTWAGLTLGWVLYLMFVTGTAGYFDTEIDRWMKPELPLPTKPNTEHTVEKIVQRLEKDVPGAERWFITLPVDRNQPYPSVFWQGASVDQGALSENGRLTLDAQTAETLSSRDTGGGQTLYQMHWRLHYLPRQYSDIIIGVATLFMMVGLITGIIIHKKIFADFFTLRLGKDRRSWLDAHNFLSVFALPFHLMITYSGLLFLGFSLMPFIISSQYPEEGRRQFYAEVFDPPGMVEAAERSAPLTSFKPLINMLEQRWGKSNIQTIDVRHPGDANARVVFYQGIGHTVSTSAERLVFDGVNGELLHREPASASKAKYSRDVFLGLHEGLFAGPALRWLYFFSGLLGTGMVATGLILWSRKRRQKADRKGGRPSRGLILVEALNAGTVVGVPVAVAVYLIANRMLPVEFSARAQWEVNSFFITWLALLLYAGIRCRTKVWFELCAVAGIAFVAVPVVNAISTQRGLISSVARGDWAFAGVDIVCTVLGVCFSGVAWKLAKATKPRPKAKDRTKAGAEQ